MNLDPPITTQNSNLDEEDAPWFTWKELPLLLLFVPFGLLLGFHIAGLAILIRRWLRIPYLITMVVFYSCLTIPLWLLFMKSSVWIPLAATSIVFAATVGPIALGGRDEIMDGTNFELSAPAHIVLILVYLVPPLIGNALQANAG